MNVNKRFDRFKQWGKERMGGEKTDMSDDFKTLETEMQLRHDGMERLKRSADAYVKSISKRDKFEEKEQQLPVAYFGSAMLTHGDDFEPESEFGQCLVMLGRANERIARTQETYCANATSSWLESLERSLVQMKEYQVARKKLESRRLAFDTASAKMQKSKREDFKMEEELRSQKMRYEESNEDVYRRMLDIKEAEGDSMNDLTSFLEAELAYYDRCREVLLTLKREWPATNPSNRGSGTSSPVNGPGRRDARSRASSAADRFNRLAEDEALEPPPLPGLRSRAGSGQNSPRRELAGFDIPVRPNTSSRAASIPGFEGPTALRENLNTARPLTRVPTEPAQLPSTRHNTNTLRVPRTRDGPESSGGGEESGSALSNGSSSSLASDSTLSASAYYGERGAGAGRRPSWTSTMAQNGSSEAMIEGVRKTPPPPPPPSRAKKPPPPPPPLKRSALSSSHVPQY